jgi:hypothetical protein
VSNETKVVVVLLALYLWWHWRNLQTALATGGTGAAGNVTPGYSSTGGSWLGAGAGSDNYAHGTAMRNLWGSQYE